MSMGKDLIEKMRHVDEQIKTLEEQYLTSKHQESELKERLDKAMLKETQRLKAVFDETKDPELSNQAKRENKALMTDDIRHLKEQADFVVVDSEQNKVAVMSLKRKFRILDTQAKLLCSGLYE